MKNKMVKFAILSLALCGAPLLASAQDSNITAANGIATTATTTYGLVATVTVSMVAFFIIIRIVKGIRR